MSTLLSPPDVIPFPAEAIEACLRDAIATAAVDREGIPAIGGGKGLPASAGWESEVDSVVALEAILALEAKFGIELPDDVVPPGGYVDVEECIGSMLRAARAAFEGKHTGGAS